MPVSAWPSQDGPNLNFAELLIIYIIIGIWVMGDYSAI